MVMSMKSRQGDVAVRWYVVSSCGSRVSVAPDFDVAGIEQFHCSMPATSKSGATDTRDPQLDTTYHLTATSPCRDFIDMTIPHPTDDLDGESRPKPATGRLDCGADEY